MTGQEATSGVGLPSIEEVLVSPHTSSWVKQALVSAMQRDPVDAANDGELVAAILARRCSDCLKDHHQHLVY